MWFWITKCIIIIDIHFEYNFIMFINKHNYVTWQRDQKLHIICASRWKWWHTDNAMTKTNCNVRMGGEVTPFYPTMMNLNIHHQSRQCHHAFYKHHASKRVCAIQFYFQLKLYSRFLFELCFAFVMSMKIVCCVLQNSTSIVVCWVFLLFVSLSQTTICNWVS